MHAIDSRMRHPKKFTDVLGKKMAYVEAGEGDPIVFLHGNITSSYMWRNIIPHLEGLGRCIAVDNIGQGDSEKLDGSMYRRRSPSLRRWHPGSPEGSGKRHSRGSRLGGPDRGGEPRVAHTLREKLIKIGARVSYHARKWHVHVASAFPLAHYYRAVFGYG